MAKFEIQTITSIPPVTRTFKGEEKYPFSDLGVEENNCFFVADADVASGDAKKTLQSAVSAAHIRFSVKDSSGAMRTVEKGKDAGKEVPVMVKTKSFIVRADVHEGVSGAWVIRTA